jgi:hypothetical protein
VSDASLQPGLSTGQTYDAYDTLVRRVEEWVGATPLRLPGFQAKHVRARIVQQVAAEFIDEYSRRAITPGFRHDSGTISLRGITVELATGAIAVSARARVRLLLEFAAVWTRFLVTAVRGLALPAATSDRRLTLLLGLGVVNDESDADFVEYVRTTPVEPIKRAEVLVVEAPHPPRQITPSHVVYVRRAIDYAATHGLGRRERLAVLRAHCAGAWKSARLMAADPLLALLARDLVLASAVRFLDAADRIGTVVITTSNFSVQPLWMIGDESRRFRLHMAWYSQNFIPKMYVGDEKPSDLPSARHIRVDAHWVWTSGFRDYLIRLGQQSDIFVVGPILWYPPKPFKPPLGAALTVAVFDVTPFVATKNVFGAARNYYSVETITRFVHDVVTVVEELASMRKVSCAILLKHKRATLTAHHDWAYVGFLEELERTKPWFRVIDHRTNNFGLVNACDISVSVPYTSTAYVAAHLRKPAIYYDPFAELVPVFEPDTLVHFAAGPDELRRALGSLTIWNSARPPVARLRRNGDWAGADPARSQELRRLPRLQSQEGPRDE